MTSAQIRSLVEQHQGKSYWADYLFSFVHAHHVDKIADITPLPQSFKQRLTQHGFFISHLNTLQTCTDTHGTTKFLFGLQNGSRLESVVLQDGTRYTVCISCQVGCRMGCRFCATGQLPFQGNLSAGQIVDQVYKIKATCPGIHNIVYMGMGEPFDNLQEVMRSVQILNDPQGLHIGQRHMTLSTCGLPEGILQLADADLQVRLAVSLHGPDDAVRQELMPVARRYSIAEVLEAVTYYQHKTQRRVTFEYCLLQGINDAPQQAQALIRRLQSLHAHVNLIEFNAYPGCPYQGPERAVLQGFAQILRQAGIETVIRYRRGREINAACGQLGASWLEKKS